MLSLANVSAAQAENYYEKDDYYTQGDPDLQSDSQWQGNGAEKLGLEGAVDKADLPAAPTRPNARRKIATLKSNQSRETSRRHGLHLQRPEERQHRRPNPER